MGNTCRYFKIFTNNNLIILFIVFVFIVYYSFAYPTPDHLNVTPVQPRIRPDITKMNVSQEEFVRMVNVYLRRIHKRSSYQTKQLLTFLHSGADVARPDSRNSLVFRTNLTRPQVESATLRMVVEAATTAATAHDIVFRVYERVEGGSRSLVASTSLSPHLLPKWTDIDVQRSTLTGDVKLEIECDSCRVSLSSVSLNLLVDKVERTKRQAAHSHTRKTDCYPGMKRKRCCRHTMDVVFKELPGYEFVIQPYVFDAGYCKGACPYRYNPANHHSSLQSLIWRQKKGGAPKPCCAPSKLDKLEILHLDEMDNTKLKVATWSNMMVLECACF